MEKKTKKIDLGYKRLGDIADKFYNEGNYLSALRFAYRQYDAYGGDPDVFARFSDIYEGMNLSASALNWWYRFLNVAREEDLPDAYEGLAVNYLNMGSETQSAYYYNKLIDVDDTLPADAKLNIIETFSKKKGSHLRFIYPPRLANYTRELDKGSKALKAGDCARAIEQFSRIEKGAKEYVAAKEMQAVAHLLAGESDKAETLCNELLSEMPDDVRVLATLSAVYLEQGRKEESRQIALRLATAEQTDEETLYKVATVCCENGLHEEAFRKFLQIEKMIPYEGRMLYFKAVSAYKSGHVDEAENTLDKICTIYPDAEVAKYYLRALRVAKDTGELPFKPEEFTYFYHLPQEERENRCRSLIRMSKCAKDEAKLFGLIALHDGYFQWCFDEMDGNDHDLQFLGLVTAEHVRADAFLQEIMLDCDVLDVLKIELLRLLYMRNEDMDVGVVISHIYRNVELYRIRIGRRKHKRFLSGYAKTASRFSIIQDGYSQKLQQTAEKLYRAIEKNDAFDVLENEDDIACAIYFLSDLKDLGKDRDLIYHAFEADKARVQTIMDVMEGKKPLVEKDERTKEVQQGETDRF